MAGMIFGVENIGDTPQLVGRRLIKTGENVTQMKPTMEGIFTDMKYVTLQNIETRGRRGGGSWKNLTLLTAIRKGTGELLYTEGARTGYTSIGGDALVRSVTRGDGTPFQIKRVTNEEVALGTSRPYAGTHQFGHRGRKIPKRNFLKFGQNDIDRWNGWIVQKLMEDLRSPK